MIPRPEDIEACWPNSGEIVCIYIVGEPADRAPSFIVGHGGCTLIEKTAKAGEHSFIPYVRVWNGDYVICEHSQHQLSGVYFKEPA